MSEKWLQAIFNAIVGKRPDSCVQAVRGSFLFFQGSAPGGTMPTEPIFRTPTNVPCSSMVACAGLVRKTIEIRGTAADLAANPVIIEGTVSEGANDKAFWFALTGNINAPGLFTIEIGAGAAQALFYEPELTWLRIRALTGEQVPGAFPPSIGATLAAVYEGYRWDQRFKQSAMGYPEPNSDYKGV